MKTFLHVFFILSVSVIVNASEDARGDFITSIEAEGKALQEIQDTVGIEAAHQIFSTKNSKVLAMLESSIRQGLLNMSDGDAIQALHEIHADSEFEVLIISDSSLSPQQKMSELIAKKMAIYAHSKMDSIQIRAEEIGYAKTFREMTDFFRSRALFDPIYNAFINSWDASSSFEIYFPLLVAKVGDEARWGWESGRRQFDFITKNSAVGVGLGIAGMDGPELMFSFGFGDKAGSYVGVHAFAGFLGVFNFGIYTNGRRLAFLFGMGVGFGGGVALSSTDIVKCK